MWSQNGDPADTARKVQKFYVDNFPDFWPAKYRPSSSPDLNSLDYAVWSKLEHSINRTLHSSVEHLKQVVRESRTRLSTSSWRVVMHGMW